MNKLDIGDPNATMIAGYFEDAFGVPPSQRTTRLSTILIIRPLTPPL